MGGRLGRTQLSEPRRSPGAGLTVSDLLYIVKTRMMEASPTETTAMSLSHMCTTRVFFWGGPHLQYSTSSCGFLKLQDKAFIVPQEQNQHVIFALWVPTGTWYYMGGGVNCMRNNSRGNDGGRQDYSVCKSISTAFLCPSVCA